MSETLLLQLVPVVLLVVQATLSVPQLVRIVRVADGGVPLTGEAVSLATGAGWLVWAVLAGEPAMGASAVLGLLGFGPTTWVLLRRGRPWRLAAGLVVSLATVQSVGMLLGGLSVLATLLTAAAVVQYGAYIGAALRCTDWSGYSRPSGGMRIAYGLGWAWYGHLVGAGPVVVWGLLTAATFVVTFSLATRALRSADSAQSSPAVLALAASTSPSTDIASSIRPS